MKKVPFRNLKQAKAATVFIGDFRAKGSLTGSGLVASHTINVKYESRFLR
jgi:hypothetical protein